jgi:hypothetical protein
VRARAERERAQRNDGRDEDPEGASAEAESHEADGSLARSVRSTMDPAAGPCRGQEPLAATTPERAL